jgi:phage/plasmid-associated DNA primase
MTDGTIESKGDNGKSFVFNLIQGVLGELVYKVNNNVLVEGGKNQHKYLKGMDSRRIVFCEEFPDKAIDEGLFKQLSEGANYEYEKMYGTVDKLRMRFKMFILSNHTPKLSGDASKNRLKQIAFSSHFDRFNKIDEDIPEELRFVADPYLGDKILAENSDELVNILVRYAMRFYKSGLPPTPQEFSDVESETVKVNDSFAEWFDMNLETSDTGKDICSFELICERSMLSKKEVKSGMSKRGYVYDKDLYGLGKASNGRYYRGGYSKVRFYTHGVDIPHATIVGMTNPNDVM